MKRDLLFQISLKVVPALINWLTRLVFFTCRVRLHGTGYREDTVGKGQQVIGTFWHYSILGVFQVMKKYSGVAMVSSSKDGEYIARLAEGVGFSTVRGSRNNQGVQALKDLIRVARAGENIAIVADGSQGPARVLQPGSILLSSRTGVPILPMAWGASRYMTIRSWDRTAFPKPFSTVDFVFGEPLLVPKGIKGDEIDKWRLVLEDRLNSLYEKVWLEHGRSEH